MGLAGAGYGASLALEGILEQALKEKALQQQKEIQLAQIEQRTQEHADQLANQRRTIELAEIRQQAEEKQAEIAANQKGEQKRAFDNVAGLGDMGLDPLAARREAMTTLGRSGVPNAQVFAREAFPEPEKPELKTYTHTDPKSGRQTLRSISLEEIQQRGGVDMGADPPKPTAQETRPMVVTMPDGTVKDLNNVLPPGAVPYDPVAARSSKPKNDQEAVDTAKEAKRLAGDLLKHPGFNGAFGLLGSYIPTAKQSTADAEIVRDSLKDLLTLENMDKMKGVLSDSDMKVLRSASTTINGRMSEDAARRELQRIVDVMSKVAGEEGAGQTAAGDELDALINSLRKPKGQ